MMHWSELDPPHAADPYKTAVIASALQRFGWLPSEPCVLGYPLEGRTQLLSGSHRWDACRLLDRSMPVVLKSFSEVQEAWGDIDRWAQIMAPIKLCEVV